MDKAGKENIKLLYNQIRKGSGDYSCGCSGRIIYTFLSIPKPWGRDIFNQASMSASPYAHPYTRRQRRFFKVQGCGHHALHVCFSFRNKTFQGTIAITINLFKPWRNDTEGIKIGKTGYARVTSRKGDGTLLPCARHIQVNRL